MDFNFGHSNPNSSLKLRAKFLARPADTIIAQAIASFSSAGVAPAPFATAKALRSQVGHPTATAAAVLTNPCVFASRTSSYSNGTSTFFFMAAPSSCDIGDVQTISDFTVYLPPHAGRPASLASGTSANLPVETT